MQWKTLGLLLACPTLLLATAAQADTPAAYKGYGLGSVDAKTLEKYAPPALPPELARRVQSLLDVRAPGAGILHPDGKRLYFGWAVTGVRQVWRLDGARSFPVQQTGGEEPTTLAAITPDGKWLVLSRDRNGEENPGLYLQSVEGGPLKLVNQEPKVQTHYETLSLDSRWLYFSANDLQPESFAIYRYEIATGQKQLLFSQPGTWSVADLRTGTSDDQLLLRKETGNIAREFHDWDIATKTLTPVVGVGEKEQYSAMYSAAPGEYLVLTPKFGEFKRLYRLRDGKFSPITEEKLFDISDFEIDPPHRRIVYQVSDKAYTRLLALDARTFKPIVLPKIEHADQVGLASVSWDGRRITLGVETGLGPRTSYVYDWGTRKLVQWVVGSVPEADPASFVEPKLDSYTARDGTKIPMFVRRPKSCEAAAKPCPVVVHFHGGPEAQSQPGFSVRAQMLLDQGFVFVEPNVRGSDGYGKTWLNADNGPKRLDVITDIEDCAKFIKASWSVGGVAPKVGIMGWSYGGYSTLVGMTKFAGAYDAGVAMVGMGSLLTFLKNTAPYRRALRMAEYGDPDKDKDALEKLSPVTYLDQVKSPLLIIQGANDPRVPVGEAIQIHDRLATKGIDSQLIVFADEGHGAQKRQNQVLEMGHLLRFFGEHLR